eukprot:19901-Heterococcus_DN1.PRE.6
MHKVALLHQSNCIAVPGRQALYYNGLQRFCLNSIGVEHNKICYKNISMAQSHHKTRTACVNGNTIECTQHIGLMLTVLPHKSLQKGYYTKHLDQHAIAKCVRTDTKHWLWQCTVYATVEKGSEQLYAPPKQSTDCANKLSAAAMTRKLVKPSAQVIAQQEQVART